MDLEGIFDPNVIGTWIDGMVCMGLEGEDLLQIRVNDRQIDTVHRVELKFGCSLRSGSVDIQ